MFHIYSFESAIFKEWLSTINQLHLANRLELNKPKNSDRRCQVNDAHPQNQFLIYMDDEVSLYKSAAVILLKKTYKSYKQGKQL